VEKAFDYCLLRLHAVRIRIKRQAHQQELSLQGRRRKRWPGL